MPFTVKAAPNPLAVAKLAARTPVAARLSSAEWERMPLAFRERSQFSAHVESIRAVATIQDKMLKVVSMQREKVARGEAFVDRGSFIADVRRVAREEGVGGPAMPGYGTLRDFQSSARLQLIYDFQAESAAQYARWKVAQDPDALDNFPAREFLRVESRQAPRDWAPRWNDAFAPFEGATRAQDGRMVALVNHPGWMKLSRFGTPWPPFDFGSGMGVESVDRADAIALGILAPDQRLESAEIGFNDALEASVEDVPPDLRELLEMDLGDAARIEGNRIRLAFPGKAPFKTFADFGLQPLKGRRDLPVAPGIIKPEEGAAMMHRGVEVETGLGGGKAVFNAETMKHWHGKTEEKLRPAFLEWAMDTVRDPLERWEQHKQDVFLKAYTKAVNTYRGCLVCVDKQTGQATNYLVKNLGQMDKARKGIGYRIFEPPS